MPVEKNMTLLTPAVLHSTALDFLKEQSPSFHRKHVLRFSLMQCLWGCILYLLCVSTLLMPGISFLRETSKEVLTNANFSQFEIKKGILSSDIKPAVWSFVLSDTEYSRQEVVVASTTSMNRFYWDDRVEKGAVKKVNGISFMPEYLYYKQGTDMGKMYYKKLFGEKSIRMTKSQLYEFSQQITDKNMVLKMTLLGLPLVLVVSMIAGALAHSLYIAVVGFLLALLAGGYAKTAGITFKLASGLYVGWAYLLVLSLIAQKVLLVAQLDLADFFLVVNIVGLLATVGVGYLWLKIYESVQLQVPIAKLKKPGR